MAFGFKSLVTAVTVGALVLAAGALAVGSASGAPMLKGKTYRFGLIAKSQSNPVFIAAKTGAMDAAKEIGEKMGCKIEIDWRTPTDEDAQKQASYIEQLTATGIDGIAISCTDAKILTGAIDTAVSKGVPVVTFDSDAPQSKRFAYYGTDDFACGQQLGREIAKAIGSTGTIAVLAGNQTAPNLQGRVRGVRDVIEKEFKGIKIKDVYYHKETAQDAVAKMEQVQGANPDITGWALVGGWPLNTQNALNKIAGKAKVVSVDALPPMIEYVRKGEVEALLGQKVYEWGAESVRLLADKAIKNQTPKEAIVKADLVVVTKANAEAYAENWKKWNPPDAKK
ncbi:sugar-binding protein [soil metagenome]